MKKSISMAGPCCFLPWEAFRLSFSRSMFGTVTWYSVLCIFFNFLRSYAGGYHADSFGRCFLLTMILYSCSFLFHFYLPESYGDQAMLILLLLSVFIIYVWAPIDHPNRPLKPAKAKEQKIKPDYHFSTDQTIMILVLRLWQPWLNPY